MTDYSRRTPVEQVGFLPPLPARHDPHALIEPASGTRQPVGVREVVGALVHGLVPVTTVDPQTTPLRATQLYLTRGCLRRAIANPRRHGRCAGSGDGRVPAIYRDPEGEHYVLDGHHRIAGAMLRGELVEAMVVGPEHKPVADEVRLATEHVAAMYGGELERARQLAESHGKRLFGPAECVDADARAIQQEAWQRFHPEYQRNAIRRQYGLPPKRRR